MEKRLIGTEIMNLTSGGNYLIFKRVGTMVGEVAW